MPASWFQRAYVWVTAAGLPGRHRRGRTV